MSKLTALALVATLALGFPFATAPATADVPTTHPCDPIACLPNGNPGNPGGSSGPHTPWPMIACQVAGDPQALPDDLRFRNVGDVVIPSGTQVLWQLKQTGEHGTYFLMHDLPVGAAIDDDDALKAGLPAKTPCLSHLI